MTFSAVITINLISRWCIPEPLDDGARTKSIHKFKLIPFPPSLSVSTHADLIKFKTSWTSYTNKYLGCEGHELNIPDKREHAKGVGLQACHQNEHDR